MKTLDLGTAQPKQVLFLKDKHRHIAYGGARGGGKSWAVRVKAILLASKYPGIRADGVSEAFCQWHRSRFQAV